MDNKTYEKNAIKADTEACPQDTKSMLEIFKLAGDPTDKEKAEYANLVLQKHGMKRVGDKLHVVYKHPELTKIFAGTKWPTWSATLLRTAGAKKSTTRIFGKIFRTVVITLP